MPVPMAPWDPPLCSDPGVDHTDGFVTCDDAGELDVTVLRHSPGLECGLE